MTDPTDRDPKLPDDAAEADDGFEDDEPEQLDADGNPVEDDADDDDESDYAAIAADYTAQHDYGRSSGSGDRGDAAGGDSAISTGRGSRDRERQSARSGLSPSEVAVHVSDRVSAVFVVVVVAVFIGILGYGLLGGQGGFLTPLPTPAPLPSATPSAAPSTAPSEAPSAAPSPSSAASGSPAASPASPTPTPNPSASPPASPSPSPIPSASPSS